MGGVQLLIGLDEAALADCNPATEGLRIEPAYLADGDKGAVKAQAEGLLAVGKNRPGNTLRIGWAGDGAHAFDVAELVLFSPEGNDLSGINEDDAFFDRLAHLVRVGRNMLGTEPGDNAHGGTHAG